MTNFIVQVMKAVIPFLFPHKASGTLTAMKIIKSTFAKKNQILRQYNSCKFVTFYA